MSATMSASTPSSLRLLVAKWRPLLNRVAATIRDNPWRSTGTLLGALLLRRLMFPPAAKGDAREAAGTPEHPTHGRRARKVALNATFVAELKHLLRIVLPGIRSKEFALLLAHTGFLVARTFASIKVAELDGAIVKTIVNKDLKAFTWHLCLWMAMAVPATSINSGIKYLESTLAVAFRTRLVKHLYDKYMDHETYYRVENLDSRLANADQSLTDDVHNFCAKLANLHSQISKPFLDIVLIAVQLIYLGRRRQSASSNPGKKNPAVAWASILALATVSLTGRLLRAISPPFGRLTAEEAIRSGNLRAAHSRLITSSEEIAFYGGEEVERNFLWKSYLALAKHMNYVYRSRIFYNMMEDLLMKYGWSCVGLVMVALPTFTTDDSTPGQSAAERVSDRTQNFVTARGLLISLSDAAERLMLSYKEVGNLAGLTHLVCNMEKVFSEAHEGRYVKQLASTADTDLMAAKGVTIESDVIEFNEVPLVTPNGDVLTKKPLTFRLDHGMHLLITGPNGCGKSSLFRTLSGLWPVHGGVLHKPHRGDLYYIPQTPYLCSGSLRDQVLYPHSLSDAVAAGVTDDDLSDLMGLVNLAYIIDRDGGWDAVLEWGDVLSGGEKQRLAMARLFYHKPKYAILDECTSAVSEDVEAKMYRAAKEMDITLMTVSHRHTLWKHHTHLLQFDGLGSYVFSPLNAEARLSLKQEKAELEQQLSTIPKMSARLEELCGLLGEDSDVLESVRHHVGHVVDVEDEEG